MEGLVVMVLDSDFWKGRSVFLTGQTGFKGSWLVQLLSYWGAEIHGYSLEAPTCPNLYEEARVGKLLRSSEKGDVNDLPSLEKALISAKPEVAFHLAAQSLVRVSYDSPLVTYETNVMGTLRFLEAARSVPSLRSIVVVTSDKCYKNCEREHGYREEEQLGGYDPYSSSKACAELVTSAYRSSFFSPEKYGRHGVAIATARAGNVIGGGDWASDRLVPDCIKALTEGRAVKIRNPSSVRPWQHVLEPLSGYLLLARRLVEKGPSFGGGWNFGPGENDEWKVARLVERLCDLWDGGRYETASDSEAPHEAIRLRLDCSKAERCLGWKPRWSLEEALRRTVHWYKAYDEKKDLQAVCLEQIADYEEGNMEP